MLCVVSCGTSTKKGSNEHVDSTTPAESQPSVVDDRILDIIDLLSAYGATSSSVNQRNPLFIPSTSAVEVTLSPSKELSFLDKSDMFSYRGSVKRNLADVIIHKYENQGTSFMVYENGNLCQISNSENGILNIELDVLSQDAIKQKVEGALSKLVDFKDFSLDIVSPLSTEPESSEKYTRYYMYTKSVNGYVTEWITYIIRNDGTLLSFGNEAIPNLDESKLKQIDKEYENELLMLKLKDIYETKGTMTVSGYTLEYKDAVMYEGTMYIKYGNIEVQVKNTDGSTSNKHCHNLLIPITSLIPAE